VRDVAAGGAAVDSRVVDELLRARSLGVDGRLGSLTDREREILRLLAEGRSNQSIANELDVTTRSVEHGINAIFAKLGLQRSDDVNRRVKAALLYLSGTNV
jgi:DNA-binding NarL/FixJ family response regulator